jgi:hypothetical protein
LRRTYGDASVQVRLNVVQAPTCACDGIGPADRLYAQLPITRG